MNYKESRSSRYPPKSFGELKFVDRKKLGLRLEKNPYGRSNKRLVQIKTMKSQGKTPQKIVKFYYNRYHTYKSEKNDDKEVIIYTEYCCFNRKKDPYKCNSRIIERVTITPKRNRQHFKIEYSEKQYHNHLCVDSSVVLDEVPPAQEDNEFLEIAQRFNDFRSSFEFETTEKQTNIQRKNNKNHENEEKKKTRNKRKKKKKSQKEKKEEEEVFSELLSENFDEEDDDPTYIDDHMDQNHLNSFDDELNNNNSSSFLVRPPPILPSSSSSCKNNNNNEDDDHKQRIQKEKMEDDDEEIMRRNNDEIVTTNSLNNFQLPEVYGIIKKDDSTILQKCYGHFFEYSFRGIYRYLDAYGRPHECNVYKCQHCGKVEVLEEKVLFKPNNDARFVYAIKGTHECLKPFRIVGISNNKNCVTVGSIVSFYVKLPIQINETISRNDLCVFFNGQKIQNLPEKINILSAEMRKDLPSETFHYFNMEEANFLVTFVVPSLKNIHSGSNIDFGISLNGKNVQTRNQMYITYSLEGEKCKKRKRTFDQDIHHQTPSFEKGQILGVSFSEKEDICSILCSFDGKEIERESLKSLHCSNVNVFFDEKEVEVHSIDTAKGKTSENTSTLSIKVKQKRGTMDLSSSSLSVVLAMNRTIYRCFSKSPFNNGNMLIKEEEQEIQHHEEMDFLEDEDPVSTPKQIEEDPIYYHDFLDLGNKLPFF